MGRDSSGGEPGFRRTWGRTKAFVCVRRSFDNDSVSGTAVHPALLSGGRRAEHVARHGPPRPRLAPGGRMRPNCACNFVCVCGREGVVGGGGVRARAFFFFFVGVCE